MHLWPSLKIRESFKFDYIKKLELNLKKMENESQANKKKLLDTEGGDDISPAVEGQGTLAYFRELFIILSCCYCCFGCGGNPTSSFYGSLFCMFLLSFYIFLRWVSYTWCLCVCGRVLGVF